MCSNPTALSLGKCALFFIVFSAISPCALGQQASGFCIAPGGYLVTNNHVVDGIHDILISDDKGRQHSAKVVRTDSANDLAILKLVSSECSPLPIRSSSEVLKGTSVFTVGFPNAIIQGPEAKITDGIVNSLSGDGGAPNKFQISVAIQPGNSGGPVLDMSGAVIGVVTSKLDRAKTLSVNGSLPENVNYAIKSRHLLELAQSIPGMTAMLRKPDSAQAKPLPTLVRDVEPSVVFVSSFGNTIVPKKPEGDSPVLPVQETADKPVPKQKDGTRAVDLEAISQLRILAEKGNPSAQVNLGYKYERGIGTEKDPAEALRWYRAAAEQGNALAQSNLGSMYNQGIGVVRDNQQAVTWFRRAAEQGNAAAQNNLGTMYNNGLGVTRDDTEAIKWFRLAADQGNANAQNNLGSMYNNGLGTGRDDKEAIKWFRKAADQGNAAAENNLGAMCNEGFGIAKDETEAVKWFRRSAEKGNPDGQYDLALMLQAGFGADKDEAQAATWYRKSAEQGKPAAQVNLGIMYETGRGVSKDLAEAVKWYRRAAAQGDKKAIDNLRILGLDTKTR